MLRDPILFAARHGHCHSVRRELRASTPTLRMFTAAPQSGDKYTQRAPQRQIRVSVFASGPLFLPANTAGTRMEAARQTAGTRERYIINDMKLRFEENDANVTAYRRFWLHLHISPPSSGDPHQIMKHIIAKYSISLLMAVAMAAAAGCSHGISFDIEGELADKAA